VVDAHYADPRLAALYDPLDADRSDLAAYAAMVAEFGAVRVLDIGCGTGTLACLLAGQGYEVTGLDPARAELDIARAKQHGDRVRWVCGTAADLPPLQVDLVTMTGNVAQVFLDDEDWAEVVGAAYRALRPGGLLAFETRDPAQRAWLTWNRQESYSDRFIPGVGTVRYWGEVTEVRGDLVSFRQTYAFGADGGTLVSDSTLRFRSREEIAASLERAGFTVSEVRDAPDRPGKEWVFIALRLGQ
jgi:SAM-dependent methyltransferase